jgi:hypothetical protein
MRGRDFPGQRIKTCLVYIGESDIAAACGQFQR